MIFQRLRVFVSSKMAELALEREAVKTALDTLKVDAWVFEQDAGARPESIQKAFLEEVQTADLYLGLLWKGYGDYTIEEYEHARKLGKDCLVYEKRAGIDGQRDARLQAFLNQLSDVKTGLTIKCFNTPDELSEAVKDDVAKWQARIIRERRTPRINVSLSLAEKKERDDLLILLRKVKEFWVEGVLEKSVHGQLLIDLGKEAWTEKAGHPWEQVLELPDQTSRTLRPEEPIRKIFNDLGRSLLILGAPGSGKTITLLVLARELISHAEDEPTQPIPVVFNLSSWTDPRQNLLDWLIDELLVKYHIPKKIGSRWLETNWIVPLLDGLDEVKPAIQSGCVEAITAYMQNNGVPGIAVCSRLKEYTDSPVRLHVSGAICLQPLTPEQVKDYLARSGDALAGLSAALEKDQVLQTLAQTPLMLDVMSLAYRDLPTEELTNRALNTEKERRSHLFDTYIDKMFIRKGKRTQEYTREHTLGWLSWLARRIQQHGQTLFLIEQLQPSWLTTRGQRLVYILGSRMVFGLIFGLILTLTSELTFGLTSGRTFWLTVGLSDGLSLGLIFGLASGLTDVWRFNRGSVWARIEKAPPRWQTVIIVAIFGLAVGLIFGLILTLTSRLIVGLIFGLIFGLIGALFWGLRSRHRSLTSDIQSVETLRWSRVEARRGFVFGLIVGLMFGLMFGLSVGLMFGLSDGLMFGLSDGLSLGLTYGLFGGLIGALFGGVRGGILDIKAIPNLGIKLSMRNAVLVGGLGLLVFGLMFGLTFWMTVGLISSGLFGGLPAPSAQPMFGLTSGLIVGLIFGVIAFFWYGGQDVIQHYILRSILYWKGYAPLRYANFLDHATRLVFLQKVGGGYIFIHRLLLEHFAAMRIDEKESASTTGSPH
jgi:hypothetical protein